MICHRMIPLVGTLLLIAGMTGCGSSKQQPLVSGTAIDGMIWEKPLSASENPGHGIKGNRVEVYGSTVIVTSSSGESSIASLDRITNLKIQRDDHSR